MLDTSAIQFVSGIGFSLSITNALILVTAYQMNIKTNVMILISLGVFCHLWQSILNFISPSNEAIKLTNTLLYSIGTTCMALIPYFRYNRMMRSSVKSVVKIGNIIINLSVFAVYLSGRNYIPQPYLYIGLITAGMCLLPVSNYYTALIIIKIIKSQTTDSNKKNIKQLLLYNSVTLILIGVSMISLILMGGNPKNRIYFEMAFCPAMLLLSFFLIAEVGIEINKLFNIVLVANISGNV